LRSCLYSITQHLVHSVNLRGNTVIDRPLADLNDQAAQDVWVDFGDNFELLTLGVLGFGDGGLEALLEFIVEFLE
jgi:hypothetical protein